PNISTAGSGVRNTGIAASAKSLRAGADCNSPIQQASTGLDEPRAASITASAAAVGSDIACGAKIASTPSTLPSARQARVAARYRSAPASPIRSTGLVCDQLGGSAALRAAS